ncbi:UDP-N-acetylglucosamine:LPS N-acetylglucosamine transferase [Streptococcus pneumoniae]|nr:UDP-N-acetylglucosamine:LPS N-acetylglucosamine transferase [Streptococcus pneumoniae]
MDIQSHFNHKLPTVLFVGGSAGARVFNQLVTDHKKELTERYNIINLTGDSSLNELSQNLFRVDYVTCHLVVKLVVVTRLKMQLTLLRKAMQKTFKKAI